MGQVKKNSDFWYHVAAFAMILVWGISFLNTRVLLDAGLTPTEIFVARFTIAYVSLLVICRFKVRYTGWRDELLFVVRPTLLPKTLHWNSPSSATWPCW